MAIQYTGIEEAELPNWFSLCERAFGMPAKYFSEPFYNDPYCGCENILVARDQKEFLAGVRLTYRNLLIHEQSVVAGGLTDICTESRYRQSRLMTDLIQVGIKRLRKEESQIFLGFTHKNTQRFIHSLGLEKYAVPYGVVPISDKNAILTERFGFRRGRSEDYREIKELYQRSLKEKAFAFERENIYWDKWMKWRMRHFYVLTDNKKICAYLVWSGIEKHKNHGYVWDANEFIKCENCEMDFITMLSLAKKLDHLPGKVRVPLHYITGNNDILSIEYDDRLIMGLLNSFEADGIGPIETNLQLNKWIGDFFIYGMDKF